MQPRIQVTFCTNCWFMSSLPSSSIPKSFSARLFSISLSPSLGAGPCSWPHWTSWCSHGPTSQAYPDPPVRHSLLPVYQLNHSPWCQSKLLHSNILNISPNTDPRGAPLLTDGHLDIELFQMQPSSQFHSQLLSIRAVPPQFRMLCGPMSKALQSPGKWHQLLIRHSLTQSHHCRGPSD